MLILQRTAAPVGRCRDDYRIIGLRVVLGLDLTCQRVEDVFVPALRLAMTALRRQARTDQIRCVEEQLPEVQTVTAVKWPVFLKFAVGHGRFVDMLGIPA
ncbi:hypothetical protein D9M71_648450 [compost metagenome]